MVKILRALKLAVEFIQRNPREAQQIVVDALKLEQEFIDWIWADFNFHLSLKQSLIMTMDREGHWAIEENIIGKDINMEKIPVYFNYIDDRALRAIDPELITVIK